MNRNGAPPEFLFKSGQSGNPKGRPKGSKNSLDAQLRVLAASRGPDAVVQRLKELGINLNGRAKPNQLACIAGTVYELAHIHKDIQAIKFLSERIDGKAIDRVELSGPEGGPVEVADARKRLLEQARGIQEGMEGTDSTGKGSGD